MENTYNFSKQESERFKMNIARAKVNEIDIDELSANIFKYQTDIMFLRIPCEKLEAISKLDELGFSYFQTDTLVYYSVDFTKYTPQSLRNNDLVFEEATTNDSSVICDLVSRIFKGYTNHYNSNPYLQKTDIIDGYVEWVNSYVDRENRKVFLVYRDNKPIAFATCHIQNDVAEGVLYGVLPEHSGGGIYSDIIRFTQNYYKENGAKFMEVSTQIQNYAVQKVWNREGFNLTRSYATIHINSLLTRKSV